MTAAIIDIRDPAPHDATEAAAAAALIFGGRPRQLFRINPRNPDEVAGATFGPNDEAGLKAWLAGEAHGHNVYFAHAERKAGAKDRKKGSLAAVHWLHVDVDPRKGEDVDSARARIHRSLTSELPEGVPPPSIIIDSGRGFVPLWRLEEPMTNFLEAEGHNTWLRDMLGGDKAQDVTRLLRLPGSVNHKAEAQGRRARLLKHEPGAVYAPDRFGSVPPIDRGGGKARPRGDDSQTPVADQDTPAVLAWADAYLRDERPATEGAGGDNHTLQVALVLRDMGCSEAVARDLMSGEWNERCQPPWHLDELAVKVENAFRYAQNRPASQSPAADFTGVRDIPPPRHIARPGPSALPVLDLGALGLLRAPERLWAVDGMVPLLKATLLTGRGGVGKSLLSQLLATCGALGAPFLGMPTRPGKAAYISWEDDADELWRRQESICAALGVPMADLARKLELISMTKEPDSLLVTFDAAGNRTVTPRGQQLEAYAVDERVRFASFDNASHLLGGDHNDVKHVAGFAHWLNSFAEKIDGATLLLHHPNKSGDDWLGSVAYENQFRSRLFMDRPLDSIDPNARVLTNPKANYAASGGEVRFRWWRGSFMRDVDLPADAIAEIVDSTEVQHDNAVFLACLAERNRQLRPVSERPSRSYAPAVFADMPESKGIGRKRLTAAMDRLFKSSTIARSVIGWDTVKRRPLEGVREVVGAALNAPNPRTERAHNAHLTSPQTRTEPSPEPPPHHTLHTTYVGGAAAMAAAIPHSDEAPPSPASLF